jgi:hypothetical protein
MTILSAHSSRATGLPPDVLMTFDVEELMATTLKLSHVMERESELLSAMRIPELAPLQPEKIQLAQKLESYQAVIRTRPEILREMPETTRDKLFAMTQQFGQIMAEHLRQIAVARAVNGKVVQAIFDTIAEQQHVPTYGKDGVSGGVAPPPISITYNQKA